MGKKQKNIHKGYKTLKVEMGFENF